MVYFPGPVSNFTSSEKIYINFIYLKRELFNSEYNVSMIGKPSYQRMKIFRLNFTEIKFDMENII